MRARLLWLAGVLAASLTVGTAVLATPTLPVILVNDTTRECVQAIQGDDCHWCEPAEGWRLLGYAGSTECPAGYADLGYVGMTGNCTTYKTEFCCTSWSHRGDCEDLVIHEAQQQCAFVEDIAGCTLPAGWKTPAELAMGEALCPSSYRWAPVVACTRPAEPSSPPAPTGSNASPTATPAATHEATARDRALVVGSALASAALIVFAAWLLLRRRRRA